MVSGRRSSSRKELLSQGCAAFLETFQSFPFELKSTIEGCADLTNFLLFIERRQKDLQRLERVHVDVWQHATGHQTLPLPRHVTEDLLYILGAEFARRISQLAKCWLVHMARSMIDALPTVAVRENNRPLREHSGRRIRYTDRGYTFRSLRHRTHSERIGVRQ